MGRSSRRRRLLAVVVASLVLCAAPARAGEAKGTLTYTGRAGPIVVAVEHAYLVRGPDVVSGKTIRRVVLSVADVSSALRSCASMMCSDGGIGEGMTIDLDAGPRVHYWFVANHQRVQYSGTAEAATLKLTRDTPQRVAGRWDMDARGAGGPAIRVEFDAELVKEMR